MPYALVLEGATIVPDGRHQGSRRRCLEASIGAIAAPPLPALLRRPGKTEEVGKIVGKNGL